MLSPYELGVGVFRGGFGDAVEGEGGDLFKPDEGDVVTSLFLALGEELIVDLARTVDQSLDVLGVGYDFFVLLF